jgi:FixJ family two-component response regulator
MTCQVGDHLIAIIDDEASVRAGLERLVRSRGYAVASYASGIDFLSSLEAVRPACVLLDLHMPALSGFEVLEALRQQAATIPVIVVTADCCPEIAEQVTALGALACLNKPVDAPALFDGISAALQDSQRL